MPLNLLEESSAPLPPPALVGLDVTLRVKPWSVSRLSTIFRDVQRSPNSSTVQTARHARHCLSEFWLTAPADQLESLYGGPIGALQRQQLEGPLPQQPLAADEMQWRDALLSRLVASTSSAVKVNLLLAAMPYVPPRTLSVEDPLNALPRWLLRDYVDYCEPGLKLQLDGPAGLLSSSVEASLPVRSNQEPTAIALDPLTERRGEAALEWFREEAALSRMQALINLYGLDSGDTETKQELAVLRLVVAQLWLDVDASQFENLYQTAVGLLTRSLHTSGFGQELVTSRDQEVRRVLAPCMANLRSSQGVRALLALLPFCPPGALTIVDSEGIPAWLQKELSLL